MGNRTIVKFNSNGDVSPIVAKWAAENGYKWKVSGSEGWYQKGMGILTAPMMLTLKNDGQDTIIESWIQVDIFTRAVTLFLLPKEMGVESGGFRLVVPRSIARTATNKLLTQLGQCQSIDLKIISVKYEVVIF